MRQLHAGGPEAAGADVVTQDAAVDAQRRGLLAALHELLDALELELPLVGEAEDGALQHGGGARGPLEEELRLADLQEDVEGGLGGDEARGALQQLRGRRGERTYGLRDAREAGERGEAAEREEELPAQRVGAEAQAVLQVLQRHAVQLQRGGEQLRQEGRLRRGGAAALRWRGRGRAGRAACGSRTAGARGAASSGSRW